MVDLEFTADGWTSRPVIGSRWDLSIWCVAVMAGALVLAYLSRLAGFGGLKSAFLVVAGISLAAAVLLVAIDFVGNLLGVASMTGRALGRGRLRAEAKGITDDLMEVIPNPEFVAVTRVQHARVVREVRGTAVELILDDGSRRRYLRTRAGLVEPFQRLLGERLLHSA
ncbi:hypothetical protein HPO96_24085 [Kribbella sandramycini]|uniref:Uncharacterized protein n=1 Tax=Kribbella sandramycini TaxID=60450 RepID=A0A7Y4L2V1_9ACTN|nr:hypothetical protein [Kribbella sandramycini]NOL43330.1 hypothetical protein [Kribbella sandramycini]